VVVWLLLVMAVVLLGEVFAWLPAIESVEVISVPSVWLISWHGSPETTPAISFFCGLSFWSKAFKKQTSLRPAIPRVLPHVQAPH